MLFLRGVRTRHSGPVTSPISGATAELARHLLEANKGRIGQVTTGGAARAAATWVYGRRGRRAGAAARGGPVPVPRDSRPGYVLVPVLPGGTLLCD